MNLGARGYQRLSGDGVHQSLSQVEEGTSRPSTATSATLSSSGAAAATDSAAYPQQPQQQEGGFPIRVLDNTGKEHAINATSSQETIGSIKTRLHAMTEVPPIQQRLIFCGKLLQDTQTLEGCGVQLNNVIHLFARPQPPSSSTSGEGGATAGTHLTGGGSSNLGGLFGDPDLIRSIHSVKLFSSCLVAICTMQLLLLMLKLLGSFSDDGQGGSGGEMDDDGNSGETAPTPPSNQTPKDNNIEDTSGMFLMQVLMNTLGLYVGLIGVRSANTLDLRTAKAYFYGLIVVGTLWLSLRVIWAIQSVNIGYDAEVGPQPGTGGGSSNSSGDGTGAGGDNGTGNGGGGEVESMTKNELIYMVSLSCMIYTGVWSVCFLRASQFYNALRRMEGEIPR